MLSTQKEQMSGDNKVMLKIQQILVLDYYHINWRNMKTEDKRTQDV